MRLTIRILALVVCAVAAGDAVRGAGLPDVPAQADPRFAQVVAPAPLEFPRDHGPHPDFRQEWWYFTGNLDAPGGERFGFELTFFRVALIPRPHSSGWRAQQYFFAHFAVTDAAQRQFHAAERSSRDALGLAGAAGAPLHVWLRDWALQQTNETGASHWRLTAQDGPYAIDLRLEPGALMLNGDRGYSRKSDNPGSASFYYSMPRLRVSGTLQRGAQRFTVRGLAWLDREWGSGALGARQSGWDWIALQLTDGSALMVYRLRDRDGTTDQHSAGTFLAPSGVATPIAARELSLSVRAHWDSPRGGRYPARWHLLSEPQRLDLEIRPILPDQELDVTPRYWEGAVDVRGTRAGQPVSGRGYVELVGYARRSGQP